ncbi:anti-sigma factor family protein [Mycolicibacterium bacteremicum]|uniref:Anti-sigma factor n=1 Tax=Mycolicibacterium bacteremicum TaxID=564198 RepID=A0A1W9Z3L3_MYCBA|nr:zf-HC2 domain-containing protein [Mycolicibacterium bacteremicum]MCV7431760.1 zf-HC2 domain-containing protein [Mycolicibacterium bacteremicum]ORA06769.1 anti-sigma factor [Mycolicibacterium bacteremicum]
MTEFDVPAGDHDPYISWDAAYILGALSPAERREFEAHLTGCVHCRAAVGELTGMPALLGKLDPAEVQSLDTEPMPRPELRDQIVGRVRARRRRSRRLATAALGLVAALLVFALVAVIRPETVGLQPGSGQQPAMLEMVKVAQTPINAGIAVSGYSWGTRIDMACSYGDWGQRDAPPQNLGMVVVGRDGSRTQIATWLGLSGATALPSGNTPLRPSEIASVQLVSVDDGTVLLDRAL